MKIVFLDFDGVLCTLRSHFAQGCPAPNGVMEALDREAVGLMNVLANGVPGVEVRFVVMSTWRNIYPREWIEAHLRKYGFIGVLHDDWRTTTLGKGESHKGGEVVAWLESHPDIVEWIAIDDKAELPEPHGGRHVKPIYNDGFSWENFRDAVKILHEFEGLPA